jgi:hypothetical protein
MFNNEQLAMKNEEFGIRGWGWIISIGKLVLS